MSEPLLLNLFGAWHTWGVPDQAWLTLVVVAVPSVLIAFAAAVVALLSLTARRSATRRHTLAVLGALTGLARMLRGPR